MLVSISLMSWADVLDQVASERFREACAIAAPRSQLGGDCKLQLAICLDSMVRVPMPEG